MGLKQTRRTGIAAMDTAHQRLTDLAHRFTAEVAAGDGVSAHRTAEALALAFHDHHECERALMHQVGDAAADQHEQEHRILTEMVVRCGALVRDARSLPALTARESLVLNVPLVLDHHIERFDLPLAERVKKRWAAEA